MLYTFKKVLKSTLSSKCLQVTSAVISLGLSSLAISAPPAVGWLEGVYVDGINSRIIAKLDTGALTSSIHGTNARKFKRNGEKWVRFDFRWEKGNEKIVGPYTVEAPLVRQVLIKDHEDDSRERYVVNLNFALKGECYTAQFSIADRSKFNYPILLGRRFQSGEVTIDTSKTFTDATVPRGKSACKKVEDEDIEQRVKLDKPKKQEAESSDKSSKKSDSKDV